MKKCPYCAEEIQDEAIKCRFCGEFLTENKNQGIVKQKEYEHGDPAQKEAEGILPEKIEKKKNIESIRAEKDELYDATVRLVLETKRTDVFFLDKSLNSGIFRINKIFDLMQQNGIIGPYKENAKYKENDHDILVNCEAMLLEHRDKKFEISKFKNENNEDELYEDAVLVTIYREDVKEDLIVSLQHYLRIDYSRAETLMNILYMKGHAGPFMKGVSKEAFGEVIQYYKDKKICKIKVAKGYITVGNWLLFVGEKRNYSQEIQVKAIQFENKDVDAAREGQSFEVLLDVQTQSIRNLFQPQALPEEGDSVKLARRAKPLNLDFLK